MPSPPPDFHEPCYPLRAHGLPGLIEVWREDGDGPILVQNAHPDGKPFIHPIVSPDGSGPLTGGAGLFTGFANVNGVDFWTDPAGGAANAGTFHPLPVGPQHLHDGRVLWSVITDWRDPGGDSLLGESQRWTLADFGGRYELDLLWTLIAHADLTFAAAPVGGPFLKWAAGGGAGPSAFDSEGRRGTADDSRRARWVAVGAPAARSPPPTVAVLDHPGNPDHPSAWRVDPSGVGTARCAEGAWRLPAGEMVAFRYRFVMAAGGVDAGNVERAWHHFSREVDEAAEGEDRV